MPYKTSFPVLLFLSLLTACLAGEEVEIMSLFILSSATDCMYYLIDLVFFHLPSG